MWGFGVLLVNAYKTYTSLMDQHNVPKANRLTHYEFRLAVARVWIDVDGDQRVIEWKAKRRNINTTTTSSRTRNSDSSTTTSDSSTTTSERTPDQQELFRSNSTSTDSQKPKSPQLSDSSLSAGGKLKCRLDFYECKHLPLSADTAGKPFAKCSLHRWTLGREGEVRKSILVCGDCNVSLCVDCYDIFHSVEDLTLHKEELKRKLTEDSANKTPSKSPRQGLKIASPVKSSKNSAKKQRK